MLVMGWFFQTLGVPWAGHLSGSWCDPPPSWWYQQTLHSRRKLSESGLFYYITFMYNIHVYNSSKLSESGLCHYYITYMYNVHVHTSSIYKFKVILPMMFITEILIIPSVSCYFQTCRHWADVLLCECTLKL